jgi:Na+/melibiose symporter-like transporter
VNDPILTNIVENNNYLNINRYKDMSHFTIKEQYKRVLYLGVSFMIMFTSYNSLQNIVSKVYDDHGLKKLGQIELMCLYAFFGITTFFSSFIVKKLGYKRTFFIASFGYAICEAVALVVVLDAKIPISMVYAIELFGSITCGISASILWVSQGSYVSRVAD